MANRKSPSLSLSFHFCLQLKPVRSFPTQMRPSAKTPTPHKCPPSAGCASAAEMHQEQTRLNSRHDSRHGLIGSIGPSRLAPGELITTTLHSVYLLFTSYRTGTLWHSRLKACCRGRFCYEDPPQVSTASFCYKPLLRAERYAR